MGSSYRYLRLRLSEAGLLPTSKMALIACYLLGMDALLFLLHKLLGWFNPAYGQSLGGWVTFLNFVVILLFAILAFRWLKARVLWRLRNRLIVTYVFIGFIPLVLLVALAIGSFYLFAGQFATFIVTSELNSDLNGLAAANSTIAHHLAAEAQSGTRTLTISQESLRHADKRWANRQVCAWLNEKIILNISPSEADAVPVLPSHPKSPFRDVVRDHDMLFLRALETVPVGDGFLTVVSSEPFGQRLIQDLGCQPGRNHAVRRIDSPKGRPLSTGSQSGDANLNRRQQENRTRYYPGEASIQRRSRAPRDPQPGSGRDFPDCRRSDGLELG